MVWLVVTKDPMTAERAQKLFRLCSIAEWSPWMVPKPLFGWFSKS